MDPVQLLKLGAALLLVLLNGWFVLAEFAMVKVRATRLTELAENGNRRAGRALHITQHIEKYLSAVQLGVTLASLALGWIGEPAIADLLHPLFARLPGSVALTHGLAVTI